MQIKVDEQTAVRESALDRFHPASDELVAHLARAVRDHHAHEHPERGEDFYCLNLVAFMGERMGPVLRRLRDAESTVRYTDVIPLHADQIDTPPGPKWQIRNARSEAGWHDVTAVVECERAGCGVMDEFAECTVLVSSAYVDGFAHWGPDAVLSVRIPASVTA